MKAWTLDGDGRRKLESAFAMAVEWHGDQLRKGTEIPYLSHLLQVAGLVLEHGGRVEEAAAALLHDSLEDAGSPDERAERERAIRSELGPGVLQIVRDCTDTGPEESSGKKRDWEQRKQAYVAHLREAPDPSVLVALCDKRHNLGAMVADVREHGPGYLDRFNAKPPRQLWYFREVIAAGGARIPSKLRRELEELVAEFAESIREGGS